MAKAIAQRTGAHTFLADQVYEAKLALGTVHSDLQVFSLSMESASGGRLRLPSPPVGGTPSPGLGSTSACPRTAKGMPAMTDPARCAV